MSRTAHGMQNLVAISLGVFAPKIRGFDVLQGATSFKAFWGVLQLATAYNRKWISAKNTTKDVVPAKNVPFGGYGNYMYIWYL